MEVFLIVVIFIGWGFVWIGKNEKRIADITEEDENIISLLSYLLKEAYTRIPDTKENKEFLLDQIELVLDEEDIEQD